MLRALSYRHLARPMLAEGDGGTGGPDTVRVGALSVDRDLQAPIIFLPEELCPGMGALHSSRLP